jgi:hypothetical protein
MDAVTLFGLSPQQLQEIAADPWKWWTFHHTTVPALKRVAPVAVALLIGMIAAVVLRRRSPPAARRVLAGCATLLLAHLYLGGFGYWFWTIVDPNPGMPTQPARRSVLVWVEFGLYWLAEAAGLWLLVWAVLVGRVKPRVEEADS